MSTASQSPETVADSFDPDGIIHYHINGQQISGPLVRLNSTYYSELALLHLVLPRIHLWNLPLTVTILAINLLQIM